MHAKANLQIVGIGTSAGGVRALQEFFNAIQPDLDAAFVVVMHLAPEARSEMAQILAARTTKPVVQVEETTALRPGHVYVIPPNRQLSIADRKISAAPFDQPYDQRSSIDMFFRPLANQHGDAIAVVLTGAGADGASGVTAIKEAGGIVLVQDPQEAEFASMPRSAIAAAVADFVLPVKALADRVGELVQRRRLGASHDPDEETALDRILAHVRARTGHDFSKYKRATVMRRITRRAQVSQADTLSDYLVRENVEEASALFADFLISVTTFFRDPASFEALAKLAIPKLLDNKDANDTIRVWVPGCATGEEAYTICMLLQEEAERRETRPEILVFGSDLDAGALAVAREGCYPVSIENDVSPDRLRRFFVRDGEFYKVRRELRDMVLFATHSLLKDPPFTKLDLVSCRNLLIYLDRDLQKQVSAMLHYALNPGGYLLLGASESAEQPAGLFRQIDREARIYQAVSMAGRVRPPPPAYLHPRGPIGLALPEPRSAPVPHAAPIAALHRQTLERIAPPSNRTGRPSQDRRRAGDAAGGPRDAVRPCLARTGDERGQVRFAVPARGACVADVAHGLQERTADAVG